ncbi:MAG: hypothetical protein HYW90_02635 [Candidatus Sungbacteria bacterium]|nr:hypothetical protein [Candidatus Sungbacteria bacterium]
MERSVFEKGAKQEGVMEVLSSIESGPHRIDFGIADLPEDREEVMRQRFRVYKKAGYYPEGLERDEDEYDQDAVFFVGRLASVDLAKRVIVGSARLIRGRLDSEFLFPAQKAHDFELPLAVQAISPEARAEVGRLVSERPEGVAMGRLTTALGLIHAILEYSKKEGLKCGLSTIKQRLFGALEFAGISFHEIPFQKIIYPKDGVIADYYYRHGDPSVPVYYLWDEIAPEIRAAVQKLNNRSGAKKAA